MLSNSGSERIFIRLILCDGFQEPDEDVERHRASDDQDLLLGRVGRQRPDLLDVDVDVVIRQGIEDALNQDGHILLIKVNRIRLGTPALCRKLDFQLWEHKCRLN